MALSSDRNDTGVIREADAARARWNRKYTESPSSWLVPDPFLESAFTKYVRPLFSHGGGAVDLAGGAGRHSIWLAQQGWKVTLMDISDSGIEQARRNAGPLASHIHFVVDDLTRLKASQTQYDLVIAFFYLERQIFPEIVRLVRPGGLLIYKTHTQLQAQLEGGPDDPRHLLALGELRQLAGELHILHYREMVAAKAMAELVAKKDC